MSTGKLGLNAFADPAPEGAGAFAHRRRLVKCRRMEGFDDRENQSSACLKTDDAPRCRAWLLSVVGLSYMKNIAPGFSQFVASLIRRIELENSTATYCETPRIVGRVSPTSRLPVPARRRLRAIPLRRLPAFLKVGRALLLRPAPWPDFPDRSRHPQGSHPASLCRG